MSRNSAILIIAHGSRRAQANADLARLAETLRPRVREEIIEIAYLELAAPTIPDGLAACVQRGADLIFMLPYFLSAGAHVTDDLQEFRRRFLVDHPDKQCRICPPIGLHPLVVDILRDRLDETRSQPNQTTDPPNHQ